MNSDMLSSVTTGFNSIESEGRSDIFAVAFTTDGHIFGGDKWGEIRRWRIADGQQIGPSMKAGRSVEGLAVSNDGQWLVTGDDGRKAIVWNARTHEKVLEVVEHTHFVYAVDFSSDSTRFATGSCDRTARVFSVTSGVRLIAPLQHDRAVVGLRFSPSGDRLVTATYDTRVSIYDSHTGERLIEVPVRVIHTPTTPFAWSNNGEELFTVSPGKITCFNMLKSSISEWSIHNNSRTSIVSNGRFIACSAGSSVSLWDVASHEQISPTIQLFPDVLCVALSPHEKLLACGHGGRISLYRYGEILPERYLFPPLFSPLHATQPTLASSVPRPPKAVRPQLMQKSVVPSPNPTASVAFHIRLSNAQAAMKPRKDALEDSNEEIRLDPSYAYERRYIALHEMGRYDEAIDSYDRMLSLMEQSRDPRIRYLRNKYLSTAQKQREIEDVVRATFKKGPLVFLDVKTGSLCDRQVLPDLFKDDPTFKELVSSMTSEIDRDRIRKTVFKYFGYVMFSHVWGNGIEAEKKSEPSFRAVKNSESVYCLPDSPMNNKLRNFCVKVNQLGFRWAWSDTCCIDKSDDATLNRSLRAMYKWYEDSDATLVYLEDVSPDIGDLIRSLWMTRAWTLQEALAPKRILFYDRDWNLYHGVNTDNHKKADIIIQELVNATGIPGKTLASFHPESLGVREKLRLASSRHATVEEDTAYSLIGIFKSDIIPRYGEGEDALGHLLEGIVAHVGDVSVLAWTGSASSYHSCLPSSLEVYRDEVPQPTFNATDTQLPTTLSGDDAVNIYHRVTRLPPVRFSNRRLQLPCIIFQVKSLNMKGLGDVDNDWQCYSAKVSNLGAVEFTTADRLPLAEPRKFVFVHPWISDIRGAASVDRGAFVSAADSDSENGEDAEMDDESGWSKTRTTSPVDDHALALLMFAYLRQPFNALLLVRQLGGEYKRVAAEKQIVVQAFRSTKSKDVHVGVLDIL